MTDEHNPLIPTGYDLTWSVISVLAIVLAIVALVSLARSAKRLSTMHTLVWTVVVLFVPVAGAIAWLAVGVRAQAPERSG